MMVNGLKTTTIGSQIQISLKQFKNLISNYESLKAENAELKKANKYLNNQIKSYNTEFTNDNKK